MNVDEKVQQNQIFLSCIGAKEAFFLQICEAPYQETSVGPKSLFSLLYSSISLLLLSRSNSQTTIQTAEIAKDRQKKYNTAKSFECCGNKCFRG